MDYPSRKEGTHDPYVSLPFKGTTPLLLESAMYLPVFLINGFTTHLKGRQEWLSSIHACFHVLIPESSFSLVLPQIPQIKIYLKYLSASPYGSLMFSYRLKRKNLLQ